MVDIGSAILTTLTGLIGVVIGASISNYVNHKIARQAAKKDTLFKKKLEYFEKVINTLVKNTQMYKNAIKQLDKTNKKAEIIEILKSLKKNRQKFEVMTSPLYLDTRKISSQIKEFVGIEKTIFNEIEKISKYGKSPNTIIYLTEKFQKLNNTGRKMIVDLRETVVRA